MKINFASRVFSILLLAGAATIALADKDDDKNYANGYGRFVRTCSGRGGPGGDPCQGTRPADTKQPEGCGQVLVEDPTPTRFQGEAGAGIGAMSAEHMRR